MIKLGKLRKELIGEFMMKSKKYYFIAAFIALIVFAIAGFIIYKIKASEKKEPVNINKLGKGITLGDALEAPHNEGELGVTIQDEYFKIIKAAGFDTVRLPIRWSAHALGDPPYTIDSNFFDRVDKIISEAEKNKLSIVIDMHNFDELNSEPANNKDKFIALWSQIGQHYSSAPDTVYFELLNEPHEKLNKDLWNEYLNEAISSIRKSNATRKLIVAPAEFNSISALKFLKLPNDTNIIVSFHFYEPTMFTRQGNEKVKESDKWLGTKWTESSQEQLDIIFKLNEAEQWSKDNNRPLWMGEFGVSPKADSASRQAWTKFMVDETEKRNMTWCFWEFTGNSGVYDLKTQKWDQNLLNALIHEKTSK